MTSLQRHHAAQRAFLSDAVRPFDFPAERKALCLRAAVRNPEERLAFARAAASSALVQYWARICEASGCQMPIRLGPIPSIEVSNEIFRLYAEACAALDSFDAFYQIGELYTSLLPTEYRARHGVFYTPPQLVRRLLDIVEAQGVDWKTARVFDPACGGAAFAAYVAQRMLAANADLEPEARLRDLRQRLIGFDIDPFATWLSAVLLDIVCLPVLRQANTHIDGIIRFGDSLAQSTDDLGEFDLVIGNPPYGKLKLTPEQRDRFSRSLYGHANLYGLFTDLAVTLTKPEGLIGFVTPTSFLGGEYFKNLRQLLVTESIPVHASFVSDREGVFSDVLQETMLAVFRRRAAARRAKTASAVRIEVETILPHSAGRAKVDPLGTNTITAKDGAPWILPRSRPQLSLVRQLSRMPTRLSDYGYRVATGQLVWNRHKSQFRDRPGNDCYPVLWAECIQPDGTFEFRAENRNHRPYVHVQVEQQFLVNQEPCVLVQRTTSKEQMRRLIAGMIPNSFIVEQPGYVVENHVNMLVPMVARPAVSLALLTRLLNSATVDHAFRCISGSVAVSAYELECLPLPDTTRLVRQVPFSRTTAPSPAFEATIRSLYHDL